MEYFKKLESNRLYLSQMRIEDTEIFCKWMNNKDVSDGLEKTKDLITIESEREIIENGNKGYGKETIIMLLDYAFNTLNLHSIEIGVI